MKEFWKSWKKLTKREEKAIESLKKGKKIILKHIPKKEIIAIYVKGSLIRRELKKKSDVDTVSVVKSNKSLVKLRRLDEDFKEKLKPKVAMRGYSLSELKTGKRSKNKLTKTDPSRFVKHLKDYKLIYGNPLDPKILFKRSDEEDLKEMIWVFEKLIFPQYKNDKIGFLDLVKQTFWLVEYEERLNGKNPPHGWKKLAKSIKDKRHIVHDALKYRKKDTKDKKLRTGYIKKLNIYVEELKEMSVN